MNGMDKRLEHLSPEQKQVLLQKVRNKASVDPMNLPIKTVPRDIENNEYPMSYSQQRMWFLYQCDKENSSYNIPCVMHFTSKVNRDLLEEAINQLVKRHEILRTTYKMVDEDLIQVVHEYKPVALEFEDLSSQSIDEAELKSKILMEKARIPFHLETDFPIRAYCYVIGQQEAYLLLNIHHIACDGWSINLIMDELQTIYVALINDAPLLLPSVSLQYVDFSNWQNQYIKSELFQKHKEYWSSVFQGEIPVLELPTDKTRPAVRSFHGARYIGKLPDGMYMKLYQFCKEKDVTLYMLNLAAYALLLSKYSNQTDIIIGSPVANRNRTEVEKMIGFFTNTIPIRIKLQENESFCDYLERVKQVTMKAFEYQDFPLEKIIEMLKIRRDTSQNPLFQVMFVMQNMKIMQVDEEDMKMYFEGALDTNNSKFDLTVSISGDFIQVEYNTDIFNESSMERLVHHFITILSSILENPSETIAHISLLSKEEERTLLQKTIKGKRNYEKSFHILDAIETHASKHKNEIALVDETQSFTYGELNKQANYLADLLIKKGIGPEKRVGILLERSANFIIAMLAVLKAGGAYVPFDPSYPHKRVQYMVEESNMSLLITTRQLVKEIEVEPEKLVFFEEQASFADEKELENPVRQTTEHNLMYLIFTSGSTGAPKAVGVQYRNFHNYLQGVLTHLDIQKPYHYAMISTLAADLGLTNIFCALCTGGTLHVLSYETSCDPDAVSAYFKKHPIDIMKAVPSHMEVLLSAKENVFLIPKKILILAGESLNYELVQKAHNLNPDCQIENHYGPTETTVSALGYKIPLRENDKDSGIVPVGRPFDNVSAYVLDKNQNLLPPGIPGELYIGGEGVTKGYVNQPELTKERFIRNPFSTEEEYLYRTGDRVKYEEDGMISIIGRMDRQVKIRGFRIELGEIEAVLNSISFVTECAVTVTAVNGVNKRINAYLVLDKEKCGENPIRELRALLSEKLPEYMVPNSMVELEALPLNLNGKIDYNMLPAIDLQSQRDGEERKPPQTETEIRIHKIWQEVLELEEIGIDDNFFELGGESFKALKLVRRVGDWIGIMDFFKYPTIRELAAFVDKGQKSERGFIHQLKEGTHTKDSYAVICVPYAGGSAITYQPLAKEMPKNYSVYSVELPGHDFSRKDEKLVSIKETARLCVEKIKEDIHENIILYGHCVGGALTIELAMQLEAAKMPLKGVVIGGAFPIARLPGRIFQVLSKLFPSDRSMSNKSYHEFLKALGGFNDIESEEERDFLIHNLRFDARESEAFFTQAYNNPDFKKLKVPITCVVGERDRATQLYEERYLEWEYFSDTVHLNVIPQAGHYFIKHQADELSTIIVESAKGEQKAAVKEEKVRPVATKETMKANLKVFAIVVLSQLVSNLGSGLTSIALGVWVFAASGAVTDFAAISSAGLIPGILALPIAGAIVDRYDRRKVMLWSDIVAALSIGILALLMATNHLEIWHIYVSCAISSISRSFHRPAFVASITQIIPKQYLGHANGIVQFAGSTSDTIAPLIGVSLYAMIGMENIFILDAFSFVFAIAVLAIVRFPNRLFHKREEAFTKEVVMGWKYIVKRISMRYLVIFFFVSNILFGCITVLFQPLILSYGSATQLATCSMLGAIGGMAGALVMSIWGGTKRRATGMIGFVILEGVFAILTGSSKNFICPAIGIFGFWCCVTLVNAHWQSIIQMKVGLELQGRVLATNQMLASSSMPIGYWIAGCLSDSVFEKSMIHGGLLYDVFGPVIGTGAGRGIALLLIFAGVCSVIWAIIGFNCRPLRYMEDYLEDAIPDAIILNRDEVQMEMDQKIIS